ncbi:MAG TPA: two-component regulator propeller domain-containing protein [Flavobacteriales bacterium]|nr:two-component regulator propeller domain-containing protein [Flavobacteriales bacterium]
MRTFFILCLLLCTTALGAQQRNFKRYAAEAGVQATVTCIFQDSRGYIWIGTQNGGLNRFDGRTFVNYNKLKGLPGNNVMGICEDPAGNLWIGVNEGLCMFNGKDFRIYTRKDGLGSNYIPQVCCDSKGIIWANANGQLFRFDGKKFRSYTTKDGLSDNRIEFMFMDSRDRLWISYNPEAGAEHVTCYEDKKFKRISVKAFDETNFARVSSFYEDKKGEMWMSSFQDKEGVFLSHLKGNAFYPSPGFSAYAGVFAIFVDSRSVMWLGTNKGVYKANYEEVLRVERDSSLRHKNVFTQLKGVSGDLCRFILEDNVRDLWFATENGVVKYAGDVFLHYGQQENLFSGVFKIFEDSRKNIWVRDQGIDFARLNSDNKFESLKDIVKAKRAPRDAKGFEDSKGNIWIGSRGEGLYKFDGENVVHFTEADGLLKPGNNEPGFVFPGYEDRFGRIWCATNVPGKIALLVDESQPPGKQLVYMERPPVSTGDDSSYAGDFVMAVCVDSKNRIWVTFRQNGLARIENGVMIPCKKQEGLPDFNVRSFFEDSKGRVWMHSSLTRGVSVFENGKFRHFDASNGYANADTWQIIEDKNGNVWFASDGDGVFVFHDNKFTCISEKDGLVDNTIWNLLIDRKGCLWVGTNKGLSRIKYTPDADVQEITNYGANEGFVGLECNDRASCMDSHGNLWFGVPGGVIKYIPDEDYRDMQAPKLAFLDVRLLFEKTDWSSYGKKVNNWNGLPETMELPYDKNHLTFSFIGISLRSSEKVRYKFMLEGQEKNWSPVTDKNEITYSGLAPGTYTFKVLSANENGIWNEQPLTYTFRISPPWWQTWWFRGLIIFSLLFAVYVVFRWRNAALLKRQAILEKTVDERTKEVVHQKEVIEEKQKEILDSITYAKRIQDAILPSQKTMKACLPDSFILYLPKDIVAGDFYFVEPVNNKVIFAAADCTGHGVPGAMVSVVCANAMKRTIKEFGLTNPGRVLDKVTDLVLETFEASGTDVKDGMDISLCTFDKSSLMLEWSGANNPLWIMRNGQCIDYTANKQPVGKFDNRKPFTTHSVQLQKGDELFIFTDGYGDQFGGPKNKKFKVSNMKELFIKILDLSCEVQMKHIHETFEAWKSIYEQVDDVCVIGVKV